MLKAIDTFAYIFIVVVVAIFFCSYYCYVFFVNCVYLKLGLSELGLPYCQEWRNGPLKLASALRKEQAKKIMSTLNLVPGESVHIILRFDTQLLFKLFLKSISAVNTVHQTR